VHSRHGAGFPDVPIVDHDPKFTRALFRAFVNLKGMGSSLIVGSVYHKNTNAKVERAIGVIGTKELLDAADIVASCDQGGSPGPVHSPRLPKPERVHPRAAQQNAV
jgi:hypothetical protein